MRRVVCATALGFAAMLPAGLCGPALAQDHPELRNSQVEIAYLEPTNPDFRPIYDRLRARKPLEELQEFLAPLRLPRKIQIQTAQCGADHLPYAGGPAIICYEYMAEVERLASTDTSKNGLERADALTGAFVQVALHQVAEVIFNVLELPVWGREEDAADKLAGFIMLQFGKDVATRTLSGTVYFFAASDHTWTGSDFSDERGTESQRFYNYLCVAYGGDRETFKYVVENKILPAARAEGCAHEYTELVYAFGKTLMPYIDLALLQKVRAIEWLKPDDGK